MERQAGSVKMASPRVGVMAVDPSRFGGLSSISRHAFGGTRTARPSLGQDQATTAPQASPELRSLIDQIVAGVKHSVTAMTQDLLSVSPDSLSADPNMYKSVPILGEVEGFSPSYIRQEIIASAVRLGTVVSRILNGSLSTYLSASDKSDLDSSSTSLSDMAERAKGYGVDPIPADLSEKAEEYGKSQYDEIERLVTQAEKSVVAGEAGTVAVKEPSERAGTVLSFVIVAAVAAAIWALLDSE